MNKMLKPFMLTMIASGFGLVLMNYIINHIPALRDFIFPPEA